MALVEDIRGLVGQTPMIHLGRIEKAENLSARLVAKVEYFNPAGSAKDRVSLALIEEAERDGGLEPGGVIIEPSSGNTAAGIAAYGTVKGYRVILVMPEDDSPARMRQLRAYGAELVLTPAADGQEGANERARALHEATPKSFLMNQYASNANPMAHFTGTGPEIWRDMRGDVDVLVAGVGTGGTLCGTAAYLKQKNPNLRVVAVEPQDCAVLSGGKPAHHGIPGIGAGFVPQTYDGEVVDEIVPVATERAHECARMVARREGFLVGISAGASLAAGLEVAKRPEMTGKTVVMLFTDAAWKYLETPGAYF